MDTIEFILASAVRLALPLCFAALGEWIAERAGTLNISIEAMMLGAAFTGLMSAVATGSPELGLAVGVATGLAVAFIFAPALRNLLFGISALDPVSFAGAALVLSASALLASYIPARRAASVSPAVALRT